MNNLFTYGTLSIPDIMKTVTGKTFRSVDACLNDFQCFLIKAKKFPGIIPSKGHYTEGKVHFDIDDDTLARLHYFEDEFYDCREVFPLLDNGFQVKALAYVIPSQHRNYLSSQRWNEADFVSKYLPEYLVKTSALMEKFNYSGG